MFTKFILQTNDHLAVAQEIDLQATLFSTIDFRVEFDQVKTMWVPRFRQYFELWASPMNFGVKNGWQRVAAGSFDLAYAEVGSDAGKITVDATGARFDNKCYRVITANQLRVIPRILYQTPYDKGIKFTEDELKDAVAFPSYYFKPALNAEVKYTRSNTLNGENVKILARLWFDRNAAVENSEAYPIYYMDQPKGYTLLEHEQVDRDSLKLNFHINVEELPPGKATIWTLSGMDEWVIQNSSGAPDSDLQNPSPAISSTPGGQAQDQKQLLTCSSSYKLWEDKARPAFHRIRVQQDECDDSNCIEFWADQIPLFPPISPCDNKVPTSTLSFYEESQYVYIGGKPDGSKEGGYACYPGIISELVFDPNNNCNNCLG